MFYPRIDVPVIGNKELPAMDSAEDHPREYLVSIKSDDPRSGWVHVQYMTAEQMKEVKEDQWEWLDTKTDRWVLTEDELKEVISGALKTFGDDLTACYSDKYARDYFEIFSKQMKHLQNTGE